MYCRNCGEQMNENQAICVKCGVKKGEGNKYCFNCGKEVSPNAAVCLSCGVALNAKGSNGKPLNGQNKTTMIIVCLLLGSIGIHNFMMGETKRGILKIVLSCCTGCGGAIWALIDLIKICNDTYVVDAK